MVGLGVEEECDSVDEECTSVDRECVRKLWSLAGGIDVDQGGGI